MDIANIAIDDLYSRIDTQECQKSSNPQVKRIIMNIPKELSFGSGHMDISNPNARIMIGPMTVMSILQNHYY